MGIILCKDPVRNQETHEEEGGWEEEKMDLKTRSAQMIRDHRSAVRTGATRTADRITQWVKEPGTTKESGNRCLMIGAAVVLWFFCVRSSPVLTLAVTPVTLLALFLWSGMKPQEDAPAPPAQDAGSPVVAQDEFWEKNTPREWAPSVDLTKADPVTHSEDSPPDISTVRMRPDSEEDPSHEENPQVRALPDTPDTVRTPDPDEPVTGKISTYPAYETYPVTGECSAGQEEVSGPQVSGVSGHPDTGHNQAKEEITESEIPTEEDENAPTDMVELMLRLSDKGASVREIAAATRRKKSTVQDLLTKAREQRAHKEVTASVRQARSLPGTPSGDPVARVVLPGAWYGEDAHAQEVRFTRDAVVLIGERTREEAATVMEFIRQAFLGKTETTTGNWDVSLTGGVIEGSVPDFSTKFIGCWSETGTVVIGNVSLS